MKTKNDELGMCRALLQILHCNCELGGYRLGFSCSVLLSRVLTVCSLDVSKTNEPLQVQKIFTDEPCEKDVLCRTNPGREFCHPTVRINEERESALI